MRSSTTAVFTVCLLSRRILAVSNASQTVSASDSDASSSSQNIGDFVAAGLGLASSSSTASASTTSSEVPTTAVPASSITDRPLSGSAHYKNVTGGNTVTTPSTSYFTSCQGTTTDSRGQAYANCDYASTIVTNTFTNTTWASPTNVDECWTEWVSYWSMHTPSPATISVISYAVPETTETTPYLYTEGSYITDKTKTTTITSTAPTIADNGGFTQTMSKKVVTYTTVLTDYLSANTTSTSMYTRTYTPWSQNYTLVSASNDPKWPAPGCTLPPVYPACQSQWDEYATHNAAPNPQPLSANCDFNLLNPNQSAPACYTNVQSSWASWRSYVSQATSPVCSQASITGDLCTSLKDAYVLGHNYNLAPNLPEPATFSSGYYSNVAPWWTGWTWPATQAFAPGCTLDCGRCAVTGGTIQLLYFPPGLTHPATEPVVATTLGTVLTSPTYYISFESLYASDACSGVGSTLTSMILPIPTSEPLSTLFATTMPCDAHRENNPWLGLIDIGTAAFNVTDLMHESVPYSIYTSQPYCASQIAASGCQPDSCPTTLPYRPLIVLSSQLLNTLDPAWATCSLDLRGLYDPPKALQPATAVAGPTTVISASLTVPATPASGPASVTPDPTAQPDKASATPDQSSNDSNSPPSPSPNPPAPSPVKTTASPSDNMVSGTPPSDPESKSADPTDPAGALVSIIAGMSNPELPSGSVATRPGTTDPGHNPAPSPEPQNTPESPTNALEALTASPVDPASAAGATVPSAPQSESGDPSHSGIPESDGTPNMPQSDPHDASQATGPGNSGATSAPPIALGPVVNGQGLEQPHATVVDGISVSAASGALVVDGTTIPAGSVPTTTTIGSQAITLQAGSGTTNYQPAGGQTVKDDPSVFSVGSQVVTAAPEQPLVIGGSTISPGVPITVNGHTYSSNNFGLVVDGTSTIELPSSGSGGSTSPVTAGSQVFTASVADSAHASALVIAGTTLTPGGSAVTIAGTRVSAGSAGVVIGGSQTIPLSGAQSLPTASSSQAVMTLGGTTLTAVLASATGDAAESTPSSTSVDQLTASGTRTGNNAGESSTASSTQSSSSRTSNTRMDWLCVALIFCIALGIAW